MEVDEMGNCWAKDDLEHKEPIMAHPELDEADARCPVCNRYIFRVKLGGMLGNERFEWRCSCGETFPGFHH